MTSTQQHAGTRQNTSRSGRALAAIKTHRDSILVGWIVAGITGIVTVIALTGGPTASSHTTPAQPVRSNVAPFSQVCIGTDPQICTMQNPVTGQPIFQTR